MKEVKDVRHDEMLRTGYESYRTYVNPLIALRAELLGEPTRVSATREGLLVTTTAPRGVVEDFHGTQTFGHRHPHITKAVTEFLATDSPNWLHASDHSWLSFEHFGVPDLADQPTTGVLMCHRLHKRGFYCFACGHDWRIMRILPRFEIPETTLDRFVTACDEEMEFLCNLA